MSRIPPDPAACTHAWVCIAFALQQGHRRCRRNHAAAAALPHGLRRRRRAPKPENLDAWIRFTKVFFNLRD